jgi:hypothetical protein
MKKPAPRAAEDRVALFEALLATIPEIERKGAAMPYTSVNGNMFSLLTPEGKLALRLPSPDREQFLQRHRTKLCEQYGVVMKEYVEVPDGLLEDTPALSPYLELSYRYASSLKPKATTRKKSAAPAARVRRPKGETR